MSKAKRNIKEKEYENGIFVIEFPEGGQIDQMYPRMFSKWEGTLDRKKKYPVRMFLKVVGFQDDRAKMRNWGKKTVPKSNIKLSEMKLDENLLELLQQFYEA